MTKEHTQILYFSLLNIEAIRLAFIKDYALGYPKDIQQISVCIIAYIVWETNTKYNWHDSLEDLKPFISTQLWWKVEAREQY